MNLRYTVDIQPIANGKTDAEIAAALLADTRHVRDVMATSSNSDETDLLDVLTEFGLLSIGADAAWHGPLVTAIAAADDATLAEGFDRLLTNLQLTNRPVKCRSHANIGELVTAVTNVAKAAVPSIASEIQQAMDSLTGGLLYAGVTAQQVAACRDLYKRGQAVESIRSKANRASEAAEGVFRSGGSVTAIIAAAKTSWDTEDAKASP